MYPRRTLVVRLLADQSGDVIGGYITPLANKSVEGGGHRNVVAAWIVRTRLSWAIGQGTQDVRVWGCFLGGATRKRDGIVPGGGDFGFCCLWFVAGRSFHDRGGRKQWGMERHIVQV